MLSYTRFFSRVAQNAINFGLVLLISEETGKAFLSSLLVLALVVPATVAGIVAGTAADTLPKRLLVFGGHMARAAICLYFLRDTGGVASYYVVAVLLATAAQFASSAEGAILPAIVERSAYARANAISHAVGGAAQLVGLGLLAPLVLRVVDSPRTLFGICAALFALAAVQAMFIGRTTSPSRKEIGGLEPSGHWWLAGWRAMRADRMVMRACIELTLISTAIIIISGLIPKYIEDVLGLPVDVGAVILTPAAIGVVIGLRVASFLAHRVPHGLLSTLGFGSFTLLLALLAFVNKEADFLSGFGLFSWLDDLRIGNFDGGGVMAMVIVAPLGFSFALVNVAANTVIDDRVPLHLRGRVGATQAAMSALSASLPVLAAGALGDVVGVPPVIAVVAAVIGIIAIMNLRPPGASSVVRRDYIG